MKILFRCDANLSIGMGHAMRCLGLAQEFKDAGCGVIFVSNSLAPRIQHRFEKENIEIFSVDAEIGSEQDALKTSYIAKEQSVDWVITDGYGFKTRYQEIIKQNNLRLVCIDDVAECEYVCDIILNQNPGFKVSDYSVRNKDTRFLLGPRYIMLRREFRELKASNMKARENKKNILVTMGGTDPQNLTGEVLDALRDFQLKKVIVLVGSINPNTEKIKSMQKTFGLSLDIVIDPEDVVPYMLEAGLAIHAAGSTSWELAYLGIPGICYILAKNQERVAEELVRSGSSCSMGWYDEFSEKKLKDALDSYLNGFRGFNKSSLLVDGKGVNRILSEIRGIESGAINDKLELRDIAPDDINEMFEWRNNPDARKIFFNPAPVSWDEHKKWFDKKINDQDASMYTAFLKGEKIGSIRFEARENDIKTSVVLKPEFFSKGFGTKIIRMGAERFVNNKGLGKPVVAEIKKTNIASLKAFTKAGVFSIKDTSDFITMSFRRQEQCIK